MRGASILVGLFGWLVIGLGCGGIVVFADGDGAGGGGTSTASSGLGSTTSASPAPPKFTCPGPPIPVACFDCIQDQKFVACVDSYNACLENDDCLPMSDCVRQCTGDDACCDACRSATPNGVATFAAFDTCLFCDACAAECSALVEPGRCTP